MAALYNKKESRGKAIACTAIAARGIWQHLNKNGQEVCRSRSLLEGLREAGHEGTGLCAEEEKDGISFRLRLAWA